MSFRQHKTLKAGTNMGITNRTLDVSEEQKQFFVSRLAVATGSTFGSTLLIATIPYPSVLKQVKIACQGLSASPIFDLSIERFIVGTGATSLIGGATSLTGVAMGTSGVQSMVLASAGSALLNLMAGDVIVINPSGADTAVTGLTVDCIIQATQDIKSWY